MADFSRDEVTGWVLCGGEGRRMGGANKGLQPYRGRPLAAWVIDALSAHTDVLHLSANRDTTAYAALLRDLPNAGQVWPDDTDVSGDARGSLGPLAGILTGLRRASTPWLMVAACDTPALPATLVQQLHRHAQTTGADIAVPLTTDPDGQQRHHWTCALIHTRCLASLEAALPSGERRVGKWVQSCGWIGVSFDHPAAFININTAETLHGQA
ncbi:MAG: molybdenum cofactor guanylyltransferase [Rubrivivax sp.]|nr:MAG: molybdenum cofactor guanylyltransferase [Rubrivivax sp.]